MNVGKTTIRNNEIRNNAPVPSETGEEKKVRKFQEAIKEAERSTLCFNLDMGNTPIMNKNTISERASLALTKMAANVRIKLSPLMTSQAWSLTWSSMDPRLRHTKVRTPQGSAQFL
jgi:hypothetical protein